jgi:hypothetical protein
VDSEEVPWEEVCEVDSEEGSDVLMGGFGVDRDSGADRTGRLCGGDHLGGIRSGGDHCTGCLGP